MRHRVFLLALLVCSARGTHAQSLSPVEADAALQRWWDAQSESYLRFYRQLHQQPELSRQEKATSALVARELERAGYVVSTAIGGFGVVGVLRNGAGRTLLLRGDMDALPIAEDSGLSYASHVRARDDKGQEVSVMHACGHDVHVTNLIATASYLAQQRSLWQGTLVVVAQPAEEVGEGALRMIDAGLFERFPRPDIALALHVDPEVRSGKVAVVSGWAAANADSVDVTFHGRGGHGARPHETVDPIVVSAQYVLALQTLVSRSNDPRDPAVITVGSLHAGTKHSVIPDTAQLQITVRSYADDVRTRLLDGVARMARELCSAARCPQPPTLSIKQAYTPAVYNDPALASTSVNVLAAALGSDSLASVRPSMGAEDFGRFGRALKIPSLLIRLGTTSEADYLASQGPNGKPVPGLHSSRFNPDAPLALRTGVRALVSLALRLLERHLG